MFIIVFYIKGIGDLRRLLENVRRLRRYLWRQKSWLLHLENAPSHTSFFAREFLTKNMTVVLHPPYFSVSRFKIKVKGRHFDTIEVIEAESHTVMNTLTEQDFQDAFENDISAGNGECARKGTTSRVMVAGRPKVRF
jgi:hypothetical protein